MSRPVLPALLSGLSLLSGPALALDYEKDIMPIFEAKCHDCHSKKAKNVKGGLHLDDPEGFFRRFAKNDRPHPPRPAGPLRRLDEKANCFQYGSAAGGRAAGRLVLPRRPYHYFQIHDLKTRTVAAAPFRDRVVHHALVRVLEPIFERRFTESGLAPAGARSLGSIDGHPGR